jgi:hypothetical protein
MASPCGVDYRQLTVYTKYFTPPAPESHALGFPLLGDIARVMGVKMLIHGHHHERYSATIAGEIRVEGIGMARTAEGFFWLGQGLGERV